MNMTNKEFAALLRDVADKIEPISDTSETERKKVIAQYDRIPIPVEVTKRMCEAFARGLLGKDKPGSTTQPVTNPKSKKRG